MFFFRLFVTANAPTPQLGLDASWERLAFNVDADAQHGCCALLALTVPRRRSVFDCNCRTIRLKFKFKLRLFAVTHRSHPFLFTPTINSCLHQASLLTPCNQLPMRHTSQPTHRRTSWTQPGFGFWPDTRQGFRVGCGWRWLLKCSRSGRPAVWQPRQAHRSNQDTFQQNGHTSAQRSPS